MSDFFGALARQLARRWLSLIAVPGLLLLGTGWIGLQLGQDNALRSGQLGEALRDVANQLTGWPVATQALVLGTVLLAALVIGLAVQALVGPVRALSVGRWPRLLRLPARVLTRRRRRHWSELNRERHALEKVHPQETRTAEQQERIDRLAYRVNRIAMAEPTRPTWMGDRLRSVSHTARQRYGLDLEFGWPRLWLVLPDAARREIDAAQGGFASAMLITTWSLPYLALGLLLWWPAVLIGIVVAGVGLARARAAVATLTELMEATVDMHSRNLAIALGVAKPGSTGPLTLEEGRQITDIVRKGR